MQRHLMILALLILTAGLLPARRGVDPAQRYFRLICLVHLTGSGQAGDPIVPEYVVQGTAAAVAGLTTTNPASPVPVAHEVQTPGTPGPSVATAMAPMSSRPGYLAWKMQVSDDGTMAIIQIVAADHHAFDSILADTRPEIRVFEIGRATPAAIQTEMRKYKKDFDLTNFQVRVQ